MNLQDYVGAIWRRRWLVIAVMALGLAAVQLIGQPGPSSTRYNATVTITLDLTEGVLPADVLLYEQITNDTSEISDRVAADLGEGIFGSTPTSVALKERVDTEANPEIGVLVLSALDMPSEQVARDVIAGYTTHLLEFSGETRITARDAQLEENRVRADTLRQEISDIEDQLKALTADQSQVERDAGLSPDRVLQTEQEVAVEQLRDVQTEIEALETESDDDLTPLRQASEPTVTDIGSTDPLGRGGRTVAALALACFLGMGLAVMLHRFDNRVFRRKDVETAFRIPVLAQVPHMGRFVRRNYPIVVQSRPDHPASEAYRLLRSGLELARHRQLQQLGRPMERGGTTILVASASAGVGRTTTVANLAAAAVAAGKRVLVVGADLRGGMVGSLLGVGPDAPGLTDAVAATMAGRRATLDAYTVPTAVPNVDMLPTGRLRVNPGETLAAARFLIQEGRRTYDMIIIDTPPMLVGNDVSELVPVSDLVLLVARAGSTTFDEGQWVDETAERLQAATCGVVLIGARSDLQKAGLSSRLRDLLSSRRRPLPRPVTGDRSALGEMNPVVSSSLAAPRAPLAPGSGRVEDPAAAEMTVRAPAAEIGPVNGVRPGRLDHPAPTGEVPAAIRGLEVTGPTSAGQASSGQTSSGPASAGPELPDIADVFSGGKPGPVGNDIDVEATIRMDAIDVSKVPIPGIRDVADEGSTGNGRAGGERTGADGNGADGNGADGNGTAAGDAELPSFSDDLEDEEDDSIVVVRVASGRTAGPASRLSDD